MKNIKLIIKIVFTFCAELSALMRLKTAGIAKTRRSLNWILQAIFKVFNSKAAFSIEWFSANALSNVAIISLLFSI